MNPVQRPLENMFKHPPIIMDLAVASHMVCNTHGTLVSPINLILVLLILASVECLRITQ